MKDTGNKITRYGIAVLLLWIGVFKFTPTEAAAIKPLVSNHFVMSWLYSIFSDQGVSILIAIPEIIVAGLLIAGAFNDKLGYYGSLASIGIFSVTLSFLLTTPGIWAITDGVPTTDFFLAKDIVFLGGAVWLAGYHKERLQPNPQ